MRRTPVAAWLLVIGIAFTIGWESGWPPARTEVQYATTPTSTWKLLGVAAPFDNELSVSDNNSLTRGRYYYFRMRHILDNGTKTPWSKKIGAVWLTGDWPDDNTFLIRKTDNSVISFPGGGR